MNRSDRGSKDAISGEGENPRDQRLRVHVDVPESSEGDRDTVVWEMTNIAPYLIPLAVGQLTLVSDRIVDASDFYPTLLELADSKPKATDVLDGISLMPQLSDQPGPTRDAAFFWYDPRPGWDKDRFRRHVFAVNRTHKLFRDGRLFRLGPQPLQETLVSSPTDEDKRNSQILRSVIERSMSGSTEPPLVNAFGDSVTE